MTRFVSTPGRTTLVLTAAETPVWHCARQNAIAFGSASTDAQADAIADETIVAQRRAAIRIAS